MVFFSPKNETESTVERKPIKEALIVALLSETADLIANIVDIYVDEKMEDLNEEERKQKVIDDKHMNALYEAQKDLFVDANGNALSLLNSSWRGQISPIMPTEYLAYYDNYNLIAYGDYDYENKFDNVFEPKIMIT